jgi:hypothetical protein
VVRIDLLIKHNVSPFWGTYPFGGKNATPTSPPV